ncbi:hypothetical protein FDF74_11500 [Clostridium niameyense]|uniref:Uncharacterized protein n=1 Tax=Clostridium niameyense TaxID=1622073 RepID=A0A6M0RC29_9CLOT|nr:hypothetical protein [Clostridium niameyense]NEZ47806.1 hypothetical protein [Clostridium niameyense]
MNIKEKRKIKKIIKFKHNNSLFNNFDKYLKISRVKILKHEFVKNIDGGKIYKVRYKHGFNLWNPLTWIIIIIPLMFISIWESFKEFKEDMQSLIYFDEIKIKN